jgi:hypothetical protein
LLGGGLIQIKDYLPCRRKKRFRSQRDFKMKTVSVAEAVSPIPDGATLMVGGFMASARCNRTGDRGDRSQISDCGHNFRNAAVGLSNRSSALCVLRQTRHREL